MGEGIEVSWSVMTGTCGPKGGYGGLGCIHTSRERPTRGADGMSPPVGYGGTGPS